MAKQLDFYFDFSSPNAYMAWTQIPELIERTNCQVKYYPVLLGGIYKTLGIPVVPISQKTDYVPVDLARVSRELGVPFVMNSGFPVNSVALLRGALVTQEEGGFLEYTDAIYKAVWVDNKNMADSSVVSKVLSDAGIDAQKIMARIGEEAIKEKLKSNTQSIVDRGAFGLPTFFVGNEMFWGRDRMHHVEEELKY
ncbi:MAG: 2-hydroxychromene-2-carboxylate isomerase [SAR324 cluster bacterium]|nr:2-hydroxychromene-2-carboxylate isomerase [SAR324 cluster bacterium]